MPHPTSRCSFLFLLFFFSMVDVFMIDIVSTSFIHSQHSQHTHTHTHIHSLSLSPATSPLFSPVTTLGPVQAVSGSADLAPLMMPTRPIRGRPLLPRRSKKAQRIWYSSCLPRFFFGFCLFKISNPYHSSSRDVKSPFVMTIREIGFFRPSLSS